jgi:hypothetical protein
LCHLVLGQLIAPSGFVKAPPNTIYRLRREIADGADMECAELIQTGMSREYRINVRLDDVVVEETFDELEEFHLFAQNDFEQLRHIGRDPPKHSVGE